MQTDWLDWHWLYEVNCVIMPQIYVSQPCSFNERFQIWFEITNHLHSFLERCRYDLIFAHHYQERFSKVGACCKYKISKYYWWPWKVWFLWQIWYWLPICSPTKEVKWFVILNSCVKILFQISKITMTKQQIIQMRLIKVRHNALVLYT